MKKCEVSFFLPSAELECGLGLVNPAEQGSSNVLGVVGACVLSNTSNVRGVAVVTRLGERVGTKFWPEGDTRSATAEGDNPP